MVNYLTSIDFIRIFLKFLFIMIITVIVILTCFACYYCHVTMTYLLHYPVTLLDLFTQLVHKFINFKIKQKNQINNSTYKNYYFHLYYYGWISSVVLFILVTADDASSQESKVLVMMGEFQWMKKCHSFTRSWQRLVWTWWQDTPMEISQHYQKGMIFS